jgi:hypothetical protein
MELVRYTGMNDEPIARPHDDELVDVLRRLAAEADPVPEDVGAAARAAIKTRDLDRELALLIADSAEPREAHVGSAAETADLEGQRAYEPVRAGGGESRRLLTFAGGDVQVDLEVSDHGDRLDLIGQFTGASTEGCALEYAGGSQRALEVDGLGRFLATGVERGPVRARFRSAAGAPMTTAWVRL